MKKILYLIPLAALALASCQKESEVRPVNNDEIRFTMDGEFGASVKTKATTPVTSLTTFNVNAVTGTMGSAETSVFNVAFSKDGSTANYVGGKYWPNANPSYKFYAANAAMTPSASGPTVAAANTQDVVCAVLASPSYKASNALTFNHIFARVGKCTITAPAGYTVSNLAVKITPNTGGTYNLYKGNGKTDGTGWTGLTAGSPTTIASALDATADNGLYLVPGSYTLTATYTLSAGDYTENFTKTSTVSIVGGKVNNISATLPGGNAQQIVFTVSVADWGVNNITATLS